jgi:hypothetical protein
MHRSTGNQIQNILFFAKHKKIANVRYIRKAGLQGYCKALQLYIDSNEVRMTKSRMTNTRADVIEGWERE